MAYSNQTSQKPKCFQEQKMAATIDNKGHKTDFQVYQETI